MECFMSDQTTYYQKRAEEYESVYAKPERQVDLQKIKTYREEVEQWIRQLGGEPKWIETDYYWMVEFRM